MTFDRKSYMASYNKKYSLLNKKQEIIRSRKYREENREQIRKRTKERYKEYGKKYRKEHLEQIRKNARKYARAHKKPYVWSDKQNVYQRTYRAKHKEQVAEKRKIYYRKKLDTDPDYRLRWLLRGRVSRAMTLQLADKAYKTIELLGCSIQEARQHLEKQFKNGMTWENHGEWEIDHRIPIASFDLTKPEEQKKAFHYTNLQPLIKLENRTKSNKLM